MPAAVEQLYGGSYSAAVCSVCDRGKHRAFIHVTCLSLLLKGFHVRFMPAQTTSTIVAMVSNFFLNNVTTYRDRALRGTR